MSRWRLVFVLVAGLVWEIPLVQSGQQPETILPIAAEGGTQESNQSISDRIALWLKTCLQDWDAATHMSRKEWQATCERVSAERGRYLRQNPEALPSYDVGR